MTPIAGNESGGGHRRRPIRDGDDLPSVSILIPTYNFARFIERSIDSALNQDYPSDRLEVIVVDDGSSDSTPSIVKGYGERVRYIRKKNGGVISSLNRLLAEARGDLLCIQSGDDISFPTRVRTQASAFVGRPELGLHYCDMALIDADDRLLHRSWFTWMSLKPERGRHPVASIVYNLAAGGSMMLSRRFLESFYPIPDWAGVEDWWITLRVSEAAELDYTEQALYGYRRHEANLSLGAQVGEARLVRHERSLLPLRRWIATQADSPDAGVAEWTRVLHDLLAMGRLVADVDNDLHTILPVDDSHRAAARAARDAALVSLAQGRHASAMRAAVAACGHDPFDHESVVLAGRLASMSGPPQTDRPFTAREFVTLTTASQLLDQPELLSEYGSTFGPEDPASLVMIVPERDIDALVDLVEVLGLADADSPDLVAVPTEQAEREVFTGYLPHANAVASAADGECADGTRLVAETFGVASLRRLFSAAASARCDQPHALTRS